MSQDRIDAIWERIRVIDEDVAHRVATLPLNDSADRLSWPDFGAHPSLPEHELGGPLGRYVPLPIRRQAELNELQAERAFLVQEIRDFERGIR